MITINIYYKGENGNAKRFADEMIKSGLVDEIRNEEGNLGYSYFFSSDDPDVVLLIDKWKRPIGNRRPSLVTYDERDCTPSRQIFFVDAG